MQTLNHLLSKTLKLSAASHFGVPNGVLHSSSSASPQGFVDTYIFIFIFLIIPYFHLLSSLPRRRFYPRRPSGQAVVTGVYHSPSRYVPCIFVAHRVQHSRCSSMFIECSQLTLLRFPLIINFVVQGGSPCSRQPDDFYRNKKRTRQP